MLQCVDLRICLRYRNSGLQPGESEIIKVPHGFFQPVFGNSQWNNGFHWFAAIFLRAGYCLDDRQVERLRHHANHGVGKSIERDHSAENVGIALELLTPELVCEE